MLPCLLQLPHTSADQVATCITTQIVNFWRLVLFLQFWTLKYVDPATYQILGNLKIVTTGVLFRLLLQRRLSLLQWISLVLLMIGATTSQVPEMRYSKCPILLRLMLLAP
jgi:multidrug transporter EmrE-like cation transporter